MGIKMPETCLDSVNNQHPQLTINHLYCCILLAFFLHIEKTFGAACAVLSLPYTSLPLHPRVRRDRLSDEDSSSSSHCWTVYIEAFCCTRMHTVDPCRSLGCWSLAACITGNCMTSVVDEDVCTKIGILS